MIINKKEVSINEALEYSDFDNLLLKRRNNNLLLSDYQVSVLSRNGINYNSYSSVRELLFEIEACLDDYYDDELDIVSSQIQEFIYYNETKK